MNAKLSVSRALVLVLKTPLLFTIARSDVMETNMASTVVDLDTVTDHSPLLALPAELRNSIYRFALVQQNDIIIDPTTSLAAAQQPSLLQANAHIRSEAIDIYYQENMHVWVVYDYNAKLNMKWQATSQARTRAVCGYKLFGKLVWANLIYWLEAYYCRTSGGIGQPGEMVVDADLRAAGEMFATVEATRDILLWDQTKQVLESVRTMAGAYDKEWLED